MRGTFAWSVRRELWEHRAIWLMPLVVAGFVLLAILLNARTLQARIGMLAKMTPEQQLTIVSYPFGIAASAVLFISFLVAVFYAVDALGTERKDRSLLFWKSMPVSDATTVLSKAFVAMVVHPALGFVAAIATQLIVLVAIVAILTSGGIEVGALVAKIPVIPMTVALVYGVAVHILWYAPGYALILMLSAWVQRPLLWIVIPVFAGQALEHLAFGTSFISKLVKWRVTGAMSEAFAPNATNGPIVAISQLDPARFFSSPGLWVGLVFAAGFIYATIHLRRSREPQS